MRSRKGFLLCFIVLALLAGGTRALATSPEPPSPERAAAMEREFVESHSHRAGSSKDAVDGAIEGLLNARCGEVRTAERRGNDPIERALATYPVDSLRAYAVRWPYRVCPAGFTRLLLHLEGEGDTKASLVPGVKGFLQRGTLYYSRDLPPAEQDNMMWMQRRYLGSADDSRTLRKRLDAESPPATPPPDSLSCLSDEECIAFGNKCGVAKIFKKAKVHHRFRCVCRRGPIVFGCFRAK